MLLEKGSSLLALNQPQPLLDGRAPKVAEHNRCVSSLIPKSTNVANYDGPMDRCAHMHGTYLRTMAYKCGSCIQMDAQDTLSQIAFASDKADFEHSHTSGLQPVVRWKWSHIRHIVTFQHD